ncbi:hypothetical protein DTO164E3_4226 [Paecilomyces variotii]|nr:hypothetical protein DTO032I3_6179 [Paecilomyces variotii]KAJ9200215.1 hypothetical protein DTO164E3_4226 [Paecilomyces variotii]KAJ9226689.1 hypothetical protein DTO169C6_929 [Paecilomyces variotii]KAJ9267762.1 hypothetical protein DTO195F2_96 [Paecilomyces variotii]KAJ9281849.1 hypothetical protein DTO021D3_1145 [Paecilomyces variotii]
MVSGGAVTSTERILDDGRVSQSPEYLTAVEEHTECEWEEGQFDDALTEVENASKRDSVLGPSTPKPEGHSRRDSKIDELVKEVVDNRASSTPTLMPVTSKEQREPAGNSDLEQGVAPQETEEEVGNEKRREEYPGPLALGLITIGICLSVFLVSLDRTIVTTAIPQITNDFNSTSSVGWYGSAYLLAACALQPTYGRIYTLFDIKWTFLQSLVFFELGSLVCAVAPNSPALIVGRAIAGWGSAGILTGSFIVVAHSVPLDKRPLYTAAVGMMFGIGAAVGPLLGGVFTGLITWRWCFYFNLPVGGVTLVAIFFFFKATKRPSQKLPVWRRILQLDLVGNVLLLGTFIMLFLALQYNDEGIPWSDPMIIGLLTGFGVSLVLFLGWQWYMQDRALMVPSILLQRSVLASCAAAFCIYATMLMHAYFLPIWFQAIKGASATSSGVDMLAYTLANAIIGIITGVVVTVTGYFAPPAILGCAIATVGCGLLSTLQPHTSTAKWVGYEILASAGLGMAVQQGFIAVQRVLRIDQVPIATAAVTCFQSLGGAVFVSVGNTILNGEIIRAAKSNKLPGVDIAKVIAAGATRFRSTVPPRALPALIGIYNGAVQKVLIACIATAGAAFVSTLFLEWKSVRSEEKAKAVSENDTSEDEPTHGSAVPEATSGQNNAETKA